MTRANWLLILAISALLAVGAWGLGGLPVRWIGSPAQVWRPELGKPQTDPVRLPTAAAASPDGMAGELERNRQRVAAGKLAANQLLEKLTALEVMAGAGVDVALVRGEIETWDQTKAAKALSEIKLKTSEFIALEKRSMTPSEDPPEAVLPADFDPIALVKPGAGEKFHVDAPAGGGRIDFAWVPLKAAGNDGFWVTATELETAPAPALKFMADEVDLRASLKCRLPKADEWLAAFAAKNPDISGLDGGFGEWLAGGLVIGKADKPGLTDLGPDWNKPVAEAARKDLTKGRAAAVTISEKGQALLEAIVREVPGANRRSRQELLQGIGAFTEQLRQQRQAAANLKANNAGETEFRYRWVLDPPLP